MRKQECGRKYQADWTEGAQISAFELTENLTL